MSGKPVSLYQLRSSDFVERAIAIVVNPMMVAGQKRLVCTDASLSARARFERELLSYAPATASDASAWAAQRIDALLCVAFGDDAWHSMLPCGTPVVLVKEGAMDGRMLVEDALRRIHTSEVSRAIAEGVKVPEAVLEDHRIFIQAMSAEREVV